MGRGAKIGMYGGGGVVAIGAGVSVYVATYTPAQRPAEDWTVELTEERVARGRYLAEHVAACTTCHFERDWSKVGGPNPEGVHVRGDCWLPEHEFPGTVCAPNLTVHEEGIGTWSDGEFARAIREGVDKDGEGLFPIMPFEYYAHLSDEDTKAIIAYFRSLEPTPYEVREAKAIDFPVSFFVKMEPKPLDGPVEAPKPADGVEYGEYLATVGMCYGCHTPKDETMHAIEDQAFAGGFRFVGDFGVAVAANITPSPEGIGGMSKEAFVQRFKNFENQDITAEANKNSAMPWKQYSKMKVEDLEAIYDYLQTVPPSDNKVVTFPNAG